MTDFFRLQRIARTKAHNSAVKRNIGHKTRVVKKSSRKSAENTALTGATRSAASDRREYIAYAFSRATCVSDAKNNVMLRMPLWSLLRP